MTEYSLGIVAAVSSNKILDENLKQSPLIKKRLAPLLEVRNAQSASEAYNQGLKHFRDTDLIVFAHQDVYIPENWYDNVVNAIKELNQQSIKWGVLGVFGKNQHGDPVGKLWDSGMGKELGITFDKPTLIETLDELLIIVNPNIDLHFDEKLPGFDLFGTDICASARSKSYKCYAICAPVIHNSKRVQSLGGNYSHAYRYLQKKWRSELPLNAVCSKITRWGIEYNRIRFGLAYRRVLGILPKRSAGTDNPKLLAKELGYE